MWDTLYKWWAMARWPLKPASVPMFIEKLADSRAGMRSAAAWALALVGPDAAAAVDPLVKAGQSDPDAEVRRRSLVALGCVGVNKPEVVQLLQRSAEDADYQVRTVAIDALTALGDTSQATQQVMAKAMQDEQPQVRWRAASGLGGMGRSAQGYSDKLVKLLDDPSWEVKGAALVALGEVGIDERENVERVMAVAYGRDVPMRTVACDALLKQGESLVPTLREILLAEADEHRDLAACLLVQIDTPAAHQALVDACHDTRPNVRRLAALTVPQFDKCPKDLAAAVRDLANDTDPDVKSTVRRLRETEAI